MKKDARARDVGHDNVQGGDLSKAVVGVFAHPQVSAIGHVRILDCLLCLVDFALGSLSEACE